jgi:cytoskeletal protein CcmA (bactofilin family)
MWKSRKEDEKPAYKPPAPQTAFTPAPNPVTPVRTVETPKMENYKTADVAHIGKSVIVKGELSGSEDLYLDGEVEGSIELRGNSLTIGPNGRVRANIHAKDVVVHGKVDGNVRGTDRVELKKSAVLNGDIATQRIVIEDGAFFKGAIDIQKADKPAEPKRENAAATSASSSPSYSSPSSSSSPSAASSTPTQPYLK